MNALTQTELLAEIERLQKRISDLENRGATRNQQLAAEFQQLQVTEQHVRGNEIRLQSLVRILQHQAPSVQALLDYALAEAIQLTESKIGYIYFYNEKKQEFTLNTWSDGVLNVCAVTDPHTVYQLNHTGIWGEAVRRRKKIMVNDFQAPHPLKKGYPKGHVPLNKFLTVPIFSSGQIVAVLGVANKETDYDQRDVLQLKLLMDGVWKEVDRKSRETALRQEKEWSRKIISHAPNIVLGLQKNSKIIVFNRFAEWMTGYSAEEVVGKEWIYTFIPEEQRETLYGVWNEIVDNQAMDHQFENEIITKSGELRLIKWHNTVLTENGEFRMILSLGEDITKRKETQAALQKANEHLRKNHRATLSILEDLKAEVQAREAKEAELQQVTMAVEQAGEVVVITDPAGVIQYVNPAFETVTGYSRDEVMGKTPAILKSGEQDDAFYRDLWNRITRGQTWKGRFINKRKDDKKYTEDATISPVLDAAGTILHFVAVKRDITEHLELSARFQQAQKMESVGRLAGGVAHDYNNMLSIILGYTELVMDKIDPSDPVQADLQEIDKAARRSTEITRKLLAFARKQTISPKVLDLNMAVESMLKMLGRLLREDLKLTWQPGTGEWQVKIDPSQVDQVLVNLCVNARDAIKGTGEIIIETKNRVFDPDYCELHKGFTPGEFVMLAVSDNGCGMDKTTLDHIFEPFFTTKQVGQGTGLGLAMVYGIMKQNNGFINVYSEPGHGTTLKMYFPRDKTGIERETSPAKHKPETGRGETILVVEDEPALLRLATRLLKNLGYTVQSAASPNQALNLAEKHAGKFQLLLTDVIMPEMNGRELANRLSVAYPDIKRLFMSGYTADVTAGQGILEKEMHFIQKPLSIHELAAKVREVLDS